VQHGTFKGTMSLRVFLMVSSNNGYCLCVCVCVWGGGISLCGDVRVTSINAHMGYVSFSYGHSS